MKTPVDLNNKTILVTGSPGFISANLVRRLLKELSGGTVVSFDSMNDYYPTSLKQWRLRKLEEAAAESPIRHVFIQGKLVYQTTQVKDLSKSESVLLFLRYIPLSRFPEALVKFHIWKKGG